MCVSRVDSSVLVFESFIVPILTMITDIVPILKNISYPTVKLEQGYSLIFFECFQSAGRQVLDLGVDDSVFFVFSLNSK